MVSPLVSQTAQGMVLSATSNLLAQALSSYNNTEGKTLSLPDWTPVLKFVLFSLVSNPPNILWQNFLEDTFPSNVPATPAAAPSQKHLKEKPVRTRTSKRNLFIKFVLDQTIGAVVNTLMFLVFMAYANDSVADALQAHVSERFWPMILDGYKFWPFVSLVSFLWIPVHKRVVFGCLVGVFWGIYLSLSVAS